MPKGPLLPRRVSLRGAATGSQMGVRRFWLVRHGPMNPAGKVRCNSGLNRVRQWFHSNSKILSWGQRPENSSCNGTVLIVVDYRAGSSEPVHPGIPPAPPKGPLGPRGALRFPGAGAGAPAPNQASSHAFSALEAYGCGPECRNSRSARNTLL